MALSVEIRNAQDIIDLFGATPRQAKVVLWRAINRAATAGKTRASVSIRQKYVLNAGDIKRSIKIRKASLNNINAQIKASGPVLPLMKFDVTPSFPDVANVRARVKKQGGRKPIGTGFVTRVGNGHVNVFTRVNKSRYPIKGLFGPSVAQMMGNDEVYNDIHERTQDVLDKRLEHELGRLLRGEF
ncbi:phage tail protein [Metasolibacillus sp. FSL H7-0170]|uniref:phage tail protein n=1 Tax=Metasolibacillus sp. FSL H7-0170 TaxID=2921431 RepID=UPI003158A5BB